MDTPKSPGSEPASTTQENVSDQTHSKQSPLGQELFNMHQKEGVSCSVIVSTRPGPSTRNVERFPRARARATGR